MIYRLFINKIGKSVDNSKENTKFLNVPSKRLYEFLNGKIQERKLTMQQVADTFERYQNNPSSFFHALKNGIMSVKLEHILKAQEHFGLNPCDLFKSDENKLSVVNEDAPEYRSNLSRLINIVESQQSTIHILAETVSGKKNKARSA